MTLPSTVHFVHEHLYFVWGVIVVGIVGSVTGCILPSILGYTGGVAAKIVYEWAFGGPHDQVQDGKHI